MGTKEKRKRLLKESLQSFSVILHIPDILVSCTDSYRARIQIFNYYFFVADKAGRYDRSGKTFGGPFNDFGPAGSDVNDISLTDFQLAVNISP